MIEDEKGSVLVSKYHDFLKIVDDEDVLLIKNRIGEAVSQIESGKFKILIMGEIKKGKSSFINALLGKKDILPVFSDIATSSIYKLNYNKEFKITVYFNDIQDNSIVDDGVSNVKFKEIKFNEIEKYGTEKGNPNNEKNVDYIQIEIDNEILKTGIEIIDTPGIGGLYKNHKKISYKFAPIADAIFFVFDSVETVITKEEIDFISDLSKITNNIYFVQTKTDLVETDSWLSYKNRNMEILESYKKQFGIEKINYFTVSSKLKLLADQNYDSPELRAEDLEDSGFIPLIDFIMDDIVKNKKKIITKACARLLLNEMGNKLNFYSELLNGIENEKDKYVHNKEIEIKNIMKQLNDFKSNKMPGIEMEFENSIMNITSQYTDKLSETLSPKSERHRNQINYVKSQFGSLDALINDYNNIINDHISYCADIGNDILRKYIESLQNAFYSLTKAVFTDIDSILKSSRNFSYAISEKIYENDGKLNEVAADIAAGGVAGAAIAGGMWWGLVGATEVGVIGGPGGALIVGGAAAAGPIGWAAIGAVALFGAFGAGYLSKKLREKSKYNEASKHLTNELDRISQMSFENGKKKIYEVKSQISKECKIIFNSIEKNTRKELELQLQEIENLKNMTSSDIAKQQLFRKKQYIEILNISNEIKSYIN